MDDKESVFHGHGESSEGHSDSPSVISTVDRVEIKEDLRKFVMMEVERKTWAFLNIKMILASFVSAVTATLVVSLLLWVFDVPSRAEVFQIIEDEIPPPEVLRGFEKVEERLSRLEGKVDVLEGVESTPRSLIELPIFPPDSND